jgi:hypothetical protein
VARFPDLSCSRRGVGGGRGGRPWPPGALGGYAIWLSTGSIPLIVVDTVGLLCGGLTLAVALYLRGSLIRQPPGTAAGPQPHTHLA